MLGAFCASVVAEVEVGLRVRARMVRAWACGDARRALMTAPPCLPVAPVMRRFWDILDVAGYGTCLKIASS